MPELERVGLNAADAGTLDAADPGAILVSSAVGEWGAIAAAAWLSRRAARRPDVGWVVERWPLHDWSRLPGCIESVHPDSFRRPGDLSEQCEASGARVLALAEEATELWREALQLASSGCAVLIRTRASTPQEWWRNLGLPESGGPGPGTDLSGEPRGIRLFWTIRSGPAGAESLESSLVLPPWPADR
jgi:hypothetical protein